MVSLPYLTLRYSIFQSARLTLEQPQSTPASHPHCLVQTTTQLQSTMPPATTLSHVLPGQLLANTQPSSWSSSLLIVYVQWHLLSKSLA